MKCGLVAADGAVLHRETRPTPREAGGRAVLDALLETVVELGQKATADGHLVRAIGVVVPGVIDAATGTVGGDQAAFHPGSTEIDGNHDFTGVHGALLCSVTRQSEHP